MSETYPNLAQLLRSARGDMFQVEFAHRLGVTQQTVSHWETGHSSPTELSLQSVAMLTGCKIVIAGNGYELIREE